MCSHKRVLIAEWLGQPGFLKKSLKKVAFFRKK